MKALVFESPGKIELIDVVEPNAPAAGEALVRVHRVGICGTDYAGFLGKMPYFSYPRIPGHELGVEVVSLGRHSETNSTLSVGDRCSVEPYINCGGCYSCRRGMTNCCDAHQTLGVMCDGGMTEYILLPVRKLHPAPALTFEQMALVETLAIGCHAVYRAKVKADENVLIVGAGPIGLSVIEFCRLSNARVIALDLSEARLRYVREKLHISETILVDPANPKGAMEQLSEMTSGHFAEAVFDATGNAASMSQAIDFCAYGGRLVYVGITQQPICFHQTPRFHRRELSILASRNALPDDFTRIISLMEAGKIDTRPWITHRLTLQETAEKFTSLLDAHSEVVKAVVELT